MILIVSISYNTSETSPEMNEYRERVRPLLIKYGGERVSSARIIGSQPDDPGKPAELHVTRFADKDAFAAMRADPDYLALEDLRKVAMKDVQIHMAEEYVTFLD